MKMTENIFTIKDSSDFLQLLLFENRLQDEVADYIAISSKYLVRRDGARLMSLEFDEEQEKTFHYPIVSLESMGYDGVQLKDRQNLVFTKSGEETVLAPIEVPYLTETLKLLSIQDYDFSVTLDTKSVVRSLLAIQRKVLNQKKEMDQIVLSFDFSKKKISVELENEQFETTVNGNTEKTNEGDVVHYSYLLFKDFFQNANSFGKEITLSIKSPYYTVIQYTDKIKGVLAHKKI